MLLTVADKPLSDRDIMATNVRPAYEASLVHGVCAEELSEELGWTRELLWTDDVSVSGEATYRHMEMMHGLPGYAEFVLDAAARYTFSSLGVVGLACKTAATVGEALALHGRYQRLTNRTATYTTRVEGGTLRFEEDRPSTRLGSLLVSEYTMFIALGLLRTHASVAPRVRAMRTRRSEVSVREREVWGRELRVELECGAEVSSLELDASILEVPLSSADPEMEEFFRGFLARAAPEVEYADERMRRLGVVIRESLVHGTPKLAQVARTLGIGAKTLQRRLAEHDTSFGAVLERTRRELAAGYLKDPGCTLTDVAYLLGYSEPASFHRAFKRWYGVTPAAWRREAMGGG